MNATFEKEIQNEHRAFFAIISTEQELGQRELLGFRSGTYSVPNAERMLRPNPRAAHVRGNIFEMSY